MKNKKDAFYFPHDTNASQDPKMMKLLSRSGLAGFGAFWALTEILHQQKNGLTEDEVRGYIAFYGSKETLEQREEIYAGLIESGLFFNRGGRIQSSRVNKNKRTREEIRQAKSRAGQASAESKRIKMEQEQFTCSTRVEHNSTKERKEKERKEKERKTKADRVLDCIFQDVFETVWTRYPVKDGKKEAFRHFQASVTTQEDVKNIQIALNNYLNHLRLNNWKKPKNGKTWFNNWQDFVSWKEPGQPDKTERKKSPECTACDKDGFLPDGKRCWCVK